MKTLSLACYNRPDYLSKTLASLQKCDWSGFDRLFVSVEHGAPSAVLDLCYAINWIPTTVNVSDVRLGCDKNTYKSICAPFDAGSVFNVYLEDDIEVGAGYAKLAEWYYLYNDRSFAFLCTESYGAVGPPDGIIVGRTFNAHGLMCNKDQFNRHLRHQWLNYALTPKDKPTGWDWNIMSYISQHDSLKMLYTVKSFSHHIGEQGTYCTHKVYKQLKQHELQLYNGIHDTFTIIP